MKQLQWTLFALAVVVGSNHVAGESSPEQKQRDGAVLAKLIYTDIDVAIEEQTTSRSSSSSERHKTCDASACSAAG